jgi:hypothetical protein
MSDFDAGQIIKHILMTRCSQGWQPTLGRDIFFGAIYFPTYNWAKKLLTKTDVPGKYRQATVLDALGAGLIAVRFVFLLVPCLLGKIG